MTPAKLTEPVCPFDLDDLVTANQEWGCNCGPGALACMVGLPPDLVRPHIPGFEERRFTNPTMMMRALRSLGVSFIELDDKHDRDMAEKGNAVQILPDYGLVRVQWEGPWLKPGVPPAVAYKYTHWIGTFRNGSGDIQVFDINSGWSDLLEWKATTVPELTALYKRATGGFRFTHRWELFK